MLDFDKIKIEKSDPDNSGITRYRASITIESIYDANSSEYYRSYANGELETYIEKNLKREIWKLLYGEANKTLIEEVVKLKNSFYKSFLIKEENIRQSLNTLATLLSYPNQLKIKPLSKETIPESVK